jgi:hypothetical protein
MRLQFRAVLYFCCTFPAADCRALQLGFGVAGEDFKKSQSQSLILSQDRALPNRRAALRVALQRCICAERQSYQNVSRETLLSDWNLKSDKSDG